MWYCKSTIFQANHNRKRTKGKKAIAVCDTAKVRFFKQITTPCSRLSQDGQLFVILQKYDFSSKSQRSLCFIVNSIGCLWYCKSTIFQANHNAWPNLTLFVHAVCDTAKVRFFKQITTILGLIISVMMLFVILQKYDFSSKSQPIWRNTLSIVGCLWYCKSTIFQANHNLPLQVHCCLLLFVILQKYDFSSKSQPDG